MGGLQVCPISSCDVFGIGVLRDDGGPDLETWRAIMEPHVGQSWLDAPWAVHSPSPSPSPPFVALNKQVKFPCLS